MTLHQQLESVEHLTSFEDVRYVGFYLPGGQCGFLHQVGLQDRGGRWQWGGCTLCFGVGGEKSGLRSTTLFGSHPWAQFMDVDYENMNLSNGFGFPAGQVEVKYCHLISKVSMLFASQAPLLPCLPPKIQLRALGQDDDAMLVPIYVGAISSKYVGEDRVSAVGCLIQKILSIKVTRKLGTWTFTEPLINVWYILYAHIYIYVLQMYVDIFFIYFLKKTTYPIFFGDYTSLITWFNESSFTLARSPGQSPDRWAPCPCGRGILRLRRVWTSLHQCLGHKRDRDSKWMFLHFNRVFHYFHHPFWGTPIFGNT